MSARAVSFRLPPFLAILAGLVIAGLALVSALALVAVSVVAGLAAIVLGRFRTPWRRQEPRGSGAELTAEYEVVHEADVDDQADRRLLEHRDPS